MESELAKKEERQIDVELKHFGLVTDRATELLSELENKLKRIMMPIEDIEDRDTSEYKKVCDIAHDIRLLKDRIIYTNERLSGIINRIEL